MSDRLFSGLRVHALRAAFAVLPLTLVAGCGPDYSPDTYASRAVQQANKVDQGIIVGVREVALSADNTVGAVTGGAAGGILGSQTPGGGVASAFGALGGTLVGGLVGTAVQSGAGDKHGYEYIVRKSNGDMLSVTQSDVTALTVGQKVLLISGNQARIVADYTVPPPPPPAPPEPALPPPTTAPTPPAVTSAPLPPVPTPTAPPSAPAAASANSPTPLAPPATTPAPAGPAVTLPTVPTP